MQVPWADSVCLLNNTLKPRRFPVSSCLEIFKNDFSRLCPSITFNNNFIGIPLFSLGQRRSVKPYFSCNLRILFMGYKYVILYIRWNPKSCSGELRMLFCDKLRSSSPFVSYKGVKQNGGISNVDFNVERFLFCNAYVNMARNALEKTNIYLTHDGCWKSVL